MDKYQAYLTNCACFLSVGNEKGDRLSIQDGKLLLKQNEDIAIKNYTLTIANYAVEKLTVIKGTQEISFAGTTEAPSAHKNSTSVWFMVPIDFENRIDAIRFSFKYNLADDVTISIEYEEADKQAYYAKKEQERKAELLSIAAVKCSTGADLVNIYFQPCCEKYAYSSIELYLADGHYSSPPMVRPRGSVFTPKLLSAKATQLIGRYRVDEGMLFKSISGLAHGAYGFKLIQYDNNGSTLLETDYQYFQIS